MQERPDPTIHRMSGDAVAGAGGDAADRLRRTDAADRPQRDGPHRSAGPRPRPRQPGGRRARALDREGVRLPRPARPRASSPSATSSSRRRARGSPRSSRRSKAPSPAWRADRRRPGDCRAPGRARSPEVFLAQASRGPARSILADQVSGEVTYRRLVLGLLLMVPADPGAARALRGHHAAGVGRRRAVLPGRAVRRQDAGDGELDHRLAQPGARARPARRRAGRHGEGAAVEARGDGRGPVGARRAGSCSRRTSARAFSPAQKIVGARSELRRLGAAAPGRADARSGRAVHQRVREPAEGRAADPREPADELCATCSRSSTSTTATC